ANVFCRLSGLSSELTNHSLQGDVALPENCSASLKRADERTASTGSPAEEDVSRRRLAGVGILDVPPLTEPVCLPKRVRCVHRKRNALDADDDVHIRGLEVEDVAEPIEIVHWHPERCVFRNVHVADVEQLLVLSFQLIQPAQI